MAVRASAVRALTSPRVARREYEAEASPAYVMSQMGHTSSALALEIYARKMERSRDTGSKMDALIKGADWALSGTRDDSGSGLS
jgi:hypothetical protein